MRFCIENIQVTLPHTNKTANIELNGKNLIITGNNGCGKTQFLNKINSILSDMIVNLDYKDTAGLTEELTLNIRKLSEHPLGSVLHEHYEKKIEEIKSRLQLAESATLSINDHRNFRVAFHEKKAVLRFFEATRQANISLTSSAESLESIKQIHFGNFLDTDYSNIFEKYLVSFITYGCTALAIRKDNLEFQRVMSWISKVENDLRELFEDSSLILKFEDKEQCFYIQQEGKTPYRFNQLSSGYSSILNIYADLLMKVELKKIAETELAGIVFIDEIDAHLHVSLQRKIFSFFSKAFPCIQFIISTHSPFVVQSVNDSVIYDLSHLEQLDDLSIYSYEAIIKGLLGEKSTSNILESYLSEIANIINQIPLDTRRLKELVDLIEPDSDKLDNRSRVFYLLGVNALLEVEGRSS